MKQDRILKRLGKALDRAIAARIPTDQDAWVRRWSSAYRREIYRVSH